MGGFWGEPDSNVEWCEPNYAVTYFVAEFWNTLSSLPMIYMGWFGLTRTRAFASPERRFALAFLSLAVVGAGSTLFHMTLRKWGQLLDEVPMLMCNAVFLYTLMENGRRPKFPHLPHALATLTAFLVLCYVALDLYWVFLLGYGSLLAIISTWSLYIALRGSVSLLARTLSGLAFCSYFAGLVLWVVDQKYCAHVAPLNLHAWWHLLAGLGTYLFIMFTVATRAWRFSKREEPAFGPLPYVVYK